MSRSLVVLPPLVAGALVAASAGAQQAARDTARLGAVTVTATRLPTPLAGAPASVTVLSGDDLRARGVTRLADALREVPGLAVVQQASFGSVTSLFTRGGESDYTKVLVDGVPVNNPGGSFDFANLTLDNVERVEVVRGPSSVVWGTDAVAGVVNIITRQGGARRASLAARGGGLGTVEGEADAQGAGAGLQWSAGGGYRRTDGLYDVNNRYRNGSLSASVALLPSANGDLRLTTRYTDARSNFPTNGSGVVVDSNQYTTDRRVTVALDGGRRLASRLEGRVLLTAAEIRSASRNDPDGPGDTTRFYSRGTSDVYRRVADARLNADLGGAGTLSLGGEYARQQLRSEGASRFAQFDLGATEQAQHRVNLAGYAQLAGARGGADWTLGTRYDDNSVFGGFLTARGAAGYRLATGTRLRAGVGNAFKEPGFDEQFDTPFTRGNAGLEPERSTSWELGLQQSALGGRVALGATYFDQRFTDLVQYGEFVVGGDTLNYQNVPSARASGVELELRLPSLGRGFDASASYTALRTRVEEAGNGSSGNFVAGERLLRRPTHAATVRLGWGRPGRARADVVVNAVATRDDNDFSDFPPTRVVLGGYATTDLSGEWTVLAARGLTPAFTITGRVENALDREYVPVSGFRAPGRRVLVGLRVGR